MNPTVVLVLSIAGLAGAVLFAVIYLIFPVVLAILYRRPVEFQVVPGAPGASDPGIQQFFNVVGPILADLGYRQAERYTRLNASGRVESEALTMVHPVLRITGIAHGLFLHPAAGNRRRGPKLTLSAELSVRFADGTVLAATNSHIVFDSDARFTPNRKIFALAPVKDPGQLEAAFRAILARDAAGREPLPPQGPGEFPGIFARYAREDLEVLLSRGILVLCRDRQRCRISLWGAYGFVWRGIGPWMWIRRRNRDRRARALLKSLGLPEPS